LKILHLSHTDYGAGAGRAAYRIHQSLLKLGLDSRMLVADKRTDDPTVSGLKRGGLSRARLCEWLEARSGRRLAANSHVLFSPASYSQFDAAAHPDVRMADVVGMYWINGGFVSPEALSRMRKPMVWRLSDIWPLSGGCHYPGTCERYVAQCGGCPQIKQPYEQDVSRQLWQRKLDAWHDLDLTIAAPSHWMASLARKSRLFRERRIEVVPTGVDLSVFRPQEKLALRERLNIPSDHLVIAFGALDPDGDARKGYAELSTALERIAASPLVSRTSALIFGRQQLLNEGLPIAARFLGRLNQDQSLADAYCAADIVAVASLEDNLPNVALEAIACGVPVCGFDVGGMPDIVRSGWNGYLAPLRDSEAFAGGMIAILSDDRLRRQMSENARIHAEEHFSLEAQASAYARIYAEIVEAKRASGAPK
jgi:glycosyltransferase involved in cell wall biosynthesis